MTNPKNPRPTVPTRRPLEPLSAEVEVAEAEAAVFEPEVAPARMLAGIRDLELVTYWILTNLLWSQHSLQTWQNRLRLSWRSPPRQWKRESKS